MASGDGNQAQSDGGTMNIEQCNITPTRARQILDEHNRRIESGEFVQRHISQNVVDQYATSLKLGQWSLNGESIKFDKSGNLIDGQHRLWACVKAQTSLPVFVVSDLPVTKDGIKTIDTIDSGKKRTVADALKLEGISSVLQVTAACRTIAIIAAQRMEQKITATQCKGILTIYDVNLRQIMTVMHHSNKHIKSFIIGPLSMYREFNRQGADDFALALFTLEGLAKGSPILGLIKYFECHKVNGGSQHMKAIKVTCLAIQHHHDGNSINQIRDTYQGMEWLINKQKTNMRKVCELIGATGQPEIIKPI